VLAAFLLGGFSGQDDAKRGGIVLGAIFYPLAAASPIDRSVL